MCSPTDIVVKFFAIGCVFDRIGDCDDLQIDQHVSLRVSLHVGLKIQFAGIVSVFLEFSGYAWLTQMVSGLGAHN